MRARLLLPLLLLAACARRSPGPSEPPSAPVVDASAAWAELARSLPGTWVLADEPDALAIDYRVVSNGSALLETFGADPAAQTLSVYHPDGRGVMLTHYCAQGNQVRLRVAEASPGRVRFEYLDVTNATPEQSVMHELIFVFGPGTLERTEVYQAHDGARATGVLRLVRR